MISEAHGILDSTDAQELYLTCDDVTGVVERMTGLGVACTDRRRNRKFGSHAEIAACDRTLRDGRAVGRQRAICTEPSQALRTPLARPRLAS